MELLETIECLSALAGPSGREDYVRDELAKRLEPLCQRVETDSMGNLLGVRPCGKPGAKKLLLDAHMDEVGLIVTGIERGFLRFAALGGVDARILPATVVEVWTEDGPLHGVIDTMPPHALSAADMERAVPTDRLVIDIGMNWQKAEKVVPLGTVVSYHTFPTRLQNHRLCGKSLDDRACAGIILGVLDALSEEKLDVDLYCQFSVQEELGMRGAGCGVYSIEPDWALVLDVTHAKTPDAQGTGLMELGKGPAIGVGPNMTRTITDALVQTARQEEIPYQMEVMSGSSGTNAWPIQISRGGIATGVVSLPLRYMHTPTEVIDLTDAQDTVRLVAAMIRRMGEWSV